ncbi:hypothetical protein DVH05_001597 [Phytophthora capsici]|nr:hypothetical protein DVH05_001597 [Phytophthora capsici]
MGARRQTRSERDAFLARLEGRSIAERARLSAEHQAYVRGERDMDADFGLDAPTDEATPGSEPSTTTSAPVPATASVAPEPPRTTSAASPLHFPPPRRPPVEKTASYIAHAKKLRAKRMAAEAAAEKKAASKKKMTKRRVAELRRDKKQAKESRAIARATSAVAARAEAKKSERDRVAEEEIRGGQAREQALAQLQKKQPSAAEKRKRSPKPAAKTQKRSKTTSPHIADGGVNDPGPSADSDEYVFDSMVYIQLVLVLRMWYIMCCRYLSPGASPQRENAPTSSTCVARYVCTIYNMFEDIHDDLLYMLF